jgi:hypothetical protein
VKPRIYALCCGALAALLALIVNGRTAATSFAGDEGCQPIVMVDSPSPGEAIRGGGSLSGWAVDPSAAEESDTGIADVMIFRDGPPDAGGEFVGQPDWEARPDVDAVFGLSDAEAGWVLDADFSDVPAGVHTLYVYALTNCGWAGVTVPFTVAGTGLEIAVDMPGNGQPIAAGQNFMVAGWAADPYGPGTGVDAVHVYADGPAGEGGYILGAASYGMPRPDVAAANGIPEWFNSGFNFVGNASGLTPGPHTLYVYAHSTASGEWDYQTVDVNVLAGPPAAPPPPANSGPSAPTAPVTYNGAPAPPPPSYDAGTTSSGTSGLPLGGCGAGYTFSGGGCVYNGSTGGYCPGGYQLSNGACSYSGIGAPSCSPGYAFDGAQCIYVGGAVNCQPGYLNQGGACVYGGSSSCGAGYAFNGSQCVYVGDPGASCIDGFMAYNGACLPNNAGSCGTGYYFNGVQCVSTGSSCPAGYVYVNGSCAYTGAGNCGAGYYYNGSQCVYTGGATTCQPGYLNQSGACVSGTGSCGTGYYFNGSQCVYTGSTSCGAGYVYSGGRCVYTGGTSSCPAGYAYLNGSCRYVGGSGCTGYSNYYNPYAPC